MEADALQILFVEDDAMNRRVVRDMLRVAELDMSEAESAESGLALVDAHRRYDLILMDLRMPGMDGLTAIRLIRQRPDEKATTPIIVVTADTAMGLRETCLSSGADDMLMKPVAMDSLFDMIGAVFAARDIPF